MVLSKGGFDYTAIRSLGIISKEKYLKQLQEIAKKMYGTPNSGNANTVDVDQ